MKVAAWQPYAIDAAGHFRTRLPQCLPHGVPIGGSLRANRAAHHQQNRKSKGMNGAHGVLLIFAGTLKLVAKLVNWMSVGLAIPNFSIKQAESDVTQYPPNSSPPAPE